MRMNDRRSPILDPNCLFLLKTNGKIIIDKIDEIAIAYIVDTWSIFEYSVLSETTYSMPLSFPKAKTPSPLEAIPAVVYVPNSEKVISVEVTFSPINQPPL
ncbi:MAG: hypothetical protein ACPHDO_05025, partial [Candidatus Poseidoniaceae archaeon]